MPTGVYVRTEKIRSSLRKRKISIRTKEWCEKISKSLRRGTIIKCIGCGKDFYCQRYRYESDKFVEKYGLPKFCSRNCSDKYRAKGQNKGRKIPKGSEAKKGNKNPMFGKKPNEKQIEGLRMGWKMMQKNKKSKAERRWTKTKCDLRRSARRKYNGGSHTFEQWEELKKQYNYTCPCCGKKESEIKLTEDHIIPIARGGTDNLDNIQPLCFRCNTLKRTKIIKYEKI